MIAVATENDITEIVNLVNSAYRGEESKKGWTTEAYLIEGQRTDADSISELMRKAGCVFLVYKNTDGVIEGSVFLEKQGATLYLGMLSVSPVQQARGTGKMLLAAAEIYATNNQCSTIEMTVLSIRHELIAWYERQGYKSTGKTKPFPTDTIDKVLQPLEFIYLEKQIV